MTWFLCIWRVLPVAGMFGLSPASFNNFRQSSGGFFFFFSVVVLQHCSITWNVIVVFDRPWCFAARSDQIFVVGDWCIWPALVFCGETQSHLLLVIVVSDWPWCFTARSDQVSNVFLTGLEVLLNYHVIYMSLCIVSSKLFQLEGEC